MKGRKLVSVLLCLALIPLVFTCCASTKKHYPEAEAQAMLAGEWKNTEFDLSERPARRIIDPQGALTVYDNTYGEEGRRTGTITVTRAWTESEGWLWFKDEVRFDDTDTVYYELSKLDLKKMDWSLLWSEGDYPAGWDAVAYPSYFYRK